MKPTTEQWPSAFVILTMFLLTFLGTSKYADASALSDSGKTTSVSEYSMHCLDDFPKHYQTKVNERRKE